MGNFRKDEYNRLHKKLTRDSLKKEIFDKYGNKCNYCGYNLDNRALQIDHVDGNGNLDRVNGKVGNWIAFLRKVLNDKTGKYQLLCANCNFIKRLDNKESAMFKMPEFEFRKGYAKVPVRQIKDGKIIGLYSSIMQAAKVTGLFPTNISAAVKQKYGQKTAGGYQWEAI